MTEPPFYKALSIRMFKIILYLIYFWFGCFNLSFANEPCSQWPKWSQYGCQRLHDIWYQGRNELYVTGYAWHNRFTYEPERVATYNELAWGGGLGKSFYDEDNDWHGLYAFAFLDSHKNVEPIAGYAFLKMLHLTDNLGLGGGFTVFVTSRSDMFHSIPFPGALPWASLTYRRASISATYIPGNSTGNVLFLLAKWLF